MPARPANACLGLRPQAAKRSAGDSPQNGRIVTAFENSGLIYFSKAVISLSGGRCAVRGVRRVARCGRRVMDSALWTARCATKRDFFLISYTGMLRREKISRFRIPGCYEEKNFPDFVYRKCYEERNFPDFVYQTCYEMKRFCSLRSKACYENKNFFLFVAEHATKTKIFSSS